MKFQLLSLPIVCLNIRNLPDSVQSVSQALGAKELISPMFSPCQNIEWQFCRGVPVIVKFIVKVLSPFFLFELAVENSGLRHEEMG